MDYIVVIISTGLSVFFPRPSPHTHIHTQAKCLTEPQNCCSGISPNDLHSSCRVSTPPPKYTSTNERSLFSVFSSGCNAADAYLHIFSRAIQLPSLVKAQRTTGCLQRSRGALNGNDKNPSLSLKCCVFIETKIWPPREEVKKEKNVSLIRTNILRWTTTKMQLVILTRGNRKGVFSEVFKLFDF